MTAHAPRKALLMRKTAGLRRAQIKQRQSSRENGLGITVVFFFLFALYNFGESVDKSKYGCSVCKKKSQLSPFQKAKDYTRTTTSLVIRTAINVDNFEGCGRAIQGHRRTGKSFHHVSAVSSYFWTFCLFLSGNAFLWYGFTFKRSDAISLKVAQNSFLFFSRLLELGAIFQAWNCTVWYDCAIF